MQGDKREYVFKLLKENKDLREEVEQLKQRIRELEPVGVWVKYRASEYFNIRVAEEIARGSRYKYEFAVLLGELDNLDVYTRRNGKEAAAEILNMLEIVLQDTLRNTDLKCYFGEGKFGIILPHTSGEGAMVAAGKLRQAVERLLSLKSQAANIRLTISTGLACYPSDAFSAENLLARAREAFAQARISGNSVCAAAGEDKPAAVVQEAEINMMQNDSFVNALDDEIARCSRYGQKFSLIIVSVHELESNRSGMDGSLRASIMRAVFHRLKTAVRTVDRCYLYTDSRFALVLPGTGADGCSVLSQKLVESISSLPAVKAGDARTTISLNMSCTSFPSDDVTRDGLLRRAEAALKYAMSKGPNSYSNAAEILSAPEKGLRDLNEWIAMLKDGGQGAVFNLLAVLDMTERYDPPHSQAVARLALATGKVMGLPAVSLQRLRIMAMLHDIGKICIAPAIITRPGPLRDDEWEEMMKHPQYGAAILEQLPDLAYCCLPVLSHHEMWDGSGYPQGIKGDSIPLESRIIAVAEAFDDMVSARPYRSLVLVNDALNELRSKSGIQFDPHVVEAFLKTLPGKSSG